MTSVTREGAVESEVASMALRWAIDSAQGWVRVTLIPPYTRDQAQAAAATIVRDPAFASENGFLIDTIGTAAPSFVRDIATFFVTNRKRFLGARVAIVVNLQSLLENGQSALIEPSSLPVTIRVFRSYKAAERWLSEEREGR